MTLVGAQQSLKPFTPSDIDCLALVQAKKFLGGVDWIRARTALSDFYNRDALAQQRRCIIPQQVSPPQSYLPIPSCKGFHMA
jgi:hypothetical protein